MPWQFRDIQLIYSWYTSINPSYHKVFTRWTLFANKRWPAPWEISARLTATWIQADLGRFGRCVPEIQEALTGDWFKAGWWCNNHLEKWWSSSMGRIIPYIYIYIRATPWRKLKKCLKAPTRKESLQEAIVIVIRIELTPATCPEKNKTKAACRFKTNIPYPKKHVSLQLWPFYQL